MRKILLLLTVFLAVSAEAQVGQTLSTTSVARRNVAMATVAFGSVTASHTSFLANASTLAFQDIDILNLTDAQITCSYDGGTTDHFTVPAYSGYDPELGDLALHHSSTIFCKRTSAAPTVGAVYISAGY